MSREIINGAISESGAVRREISRADTVYIAMELGERILQSGGEILRAEDTVSRICRAYGAVTVDVTVILSVIILTADFGGESINSSRRVHEISSNNLGRLARLNALSRRICRDLPTKAEFEEQLQEAEKASVIKPLRQLLGGILTAAGFAAFFGGGWIDSLFSAIIVLPMTVLGILLAKTRINNFIAKFLVCFVGGMGAVLISRLGIPCNADMIMIGDIMTVIPGVLLTNSFRDLFSGDVMSGFFRLCTAVLDAVTIACGYAVAILIIGGVV